MKQLGSPTYFGACGVGGEYLRCPPEATHFVITAWPIPAVESPPAAGLTRSHLTVALMRDDRAPGIGGTTVPFAGYDLADEPKGTPLPLHNAAGIAPMDGGAAGCSAITGGRVTWFAAEGG
jgi:hypothetical protein